MRRLLADAATGRAGAERAGTAAAAPSNRPRRARQSPSFKAGVELVSLNVTVTDRASRYVTDLQQEDFQVFEDGVKQDVTFFNRTNLPIALALLLDTSASMETRLPTAQEAAIGFAKKLRPQDLAEVIDFDSRVVILQTFTNKAAELEQAIRKTSAGGSTSMYNAIYIALKDLKKVVATNADEIRRQAIVVLSDGEDTSSLLPFEEVLDLAKRSETAIYAIGLRSSEGGASQHKGFKEAEFVLRQLSQETGGRAFFPNAGRRARRHLRSDLRRAVEPVHRRLHLEERETRRRLAARRRPGRPAERRGAHQAGLLRADALMLMNFVPLALLRRSRSSPTSGTSRSGSRASGRAATTLLVAGALAHTFVIGMQTMEAGHVPMTNGRVGDLDVRLAAGCWPISTPR